MVDWIQISQNSGSGNAIITVTASSYSQLLERSTALTVRTATKSAVVTIGQRFNTTFEVTPSTITGIPYSGNSYSIGISSNLSWSITSAPAWVSFNSSSGSGSTTILMTASSNDGSARSGEVVFTNANGLVRTVAVGQAAYEVPAVSIRVSPAEIIFASSGGSRTIDVYCSGEWTLIAPSWLNLSVSSGSGNTSVTVSVGPNMGSDYSGYLVGYSLNDSSTATVSQFGYYVETNGEINPSSLSVSCWNQQSTIYITSNVSWFLTAPSWVTLSQDNGMSGSSIPVTITIAENYSSARTEDIVLRNGSNANILDTCPISQSASEEPQFNISSGNFIRTTCSGGTYYIKFNSNGVPFYVERVPNESVSNSFNSVWTFETQGNRIVATCAELTSNYPDGKPNLEKYQIRKSDPNNYVILGIISCSQDPCCVRKASGTNVYNVTTTSEPTELMQLNKALLRSFKVDGTYINLASSSIICDVNQVVGAFSCDVLKYQFSSTGSHTVEFTCAAAPQYQPYATDPYDASTINNVIPLTSLDYTTYASGRVGGLPDLEWRMGTGGFNGTGIGISGLTAITFTSSKEMCDGEHYSYYLPTKVDSYSYTYNLHIGWWQTDLYYNSFDGTNATDLWFDGYTTPTWHDTAAVNPPQKFIGLAPTGRAHASSSTDFSSIESHLPSGWTLVYDY